MGGVDRICVGEFVVARLVATSLAPRDGGFTKLGAALVVSQTRGRRWWFLTGNEE